MRMQAETVQGCRRLRAVSQGWGLERLCQSRGLSILGWVGMGGTPSFCVCQPGWHNEVVKFCVDQEPGGQQPRQTAVLLKLSDLSQSHFSLGWRQKGQTACFPQLCVALVFSSSSVKLYGGTHQLPLPSQCQYPPIHTHTYTRIYRLETV